MNAKSKAIRWAIRWGPAVGMMGLIFAVSSLPSTAIPELPGLAERLAKKGGHFLAYLILGRLIWRGFGYLEEHQPGAWVLAVLYAASDEIHQSFVPGRTPSLVDVGIDSAGAALALWQRAWSEFQRVTGDNEFQGPAGSGS